MSIFHLAESYIKKHAANLGTDVIQHLKAFAVHAESELKTDISTVKGHAAKIAEIFGEEIEDTETEFVQARVSEMPSDIHHAATAVESELEEVKAHTEHSFADLLTAQTAKTENPTESK